jgi:hypothetical protein
VIRRKSKEDKEDKRSTKTCPLREVITTTRDMKISPEEIDQYVTNLQAE